MNNPLLADLRAPRAHASFNGASGYHLDGDQARLSAEVSFAADASNAEWALQLWACKSDGAANIKVAELPLGSLAYEAIVVDGWATALPPAGDDTHTMALSLARGTDGIFGEIHDVVSFPQAARFVQPRFEGETSVRQDKNGLSLSASSVCNPRGEENVSGTLAIELWDLSETYSGGAFEGQLLASEEIGSLNGQASAPVLPLHVAQALLLPDAQLTLMLREWTAVGYVTRDFRQIALASAQVADTAPATTPDIQPAAAVTSKPAATKAKPTAKVTDKVVAKAPARKEAASATTDSNSKKVAAPISDARVSINTASADELAAIKGLSRNAAEGIVAGRPYAKLEDVVRAKGMGEKLLAKLRELLRA